MKNTNEEVKMEIQATENHTFSTCVDSIAFVNVNIAVAGESMAEIEAEAFKARCSLIATKDRVVLIRNGRTIELSDNQISVEAIVTEARSRLKKAGAPIDTREDSAGERALAGHKDGSMVITDTDLVPCHLSLVALLKDEWLVAEICDSDHISYGVKAIADS